MKKKIDTNDIFIQGRASYFHSINQAIIDNFIERNAISYSVLKLDYSDISTKGIQGPQKKMKSVATNKLKEMSYEIVAYETGFRGGIVDILAKKGNHTIAVECGSCRTGKLIDYLERDKTSL